MTRRTIIQFTAPASVAGLVHALGARAPRIVPALTLLTILLLAPLAALRAADKSTAKLSSGEYFIRQSWSQEQDFPRPYHVNVPPNPDNRKLPVLIFLHGNGGNARGAMNGFLKQHPTIAARNVTVFPDGHLKSWNISGTEDRLIPYQGGPSPVIPAKNGKLEIFSYLDGAIIHYKALGEGYGAVGAIDETTLVRFLENKR